MRRALVLLMMLALACPALAQERGVAPSAAGNGPLKCLMNPPLFALDAHIKGADFANICADVPAGEWVRMPGAAFDIFVNAQGPEGSGRYWDVVVGLGEKGAPSPNRGFAFGTSTVGWRTLQYFPRLPLPWIDDMDKDGWPQLIFWDSFPLRDDASMAEYGLMAWVYQVDESGKFKLDLAKSRRMAAEIAAAYRKPLEHPPGLPPEYAANQQRGRDSLAALLQAFADGRCVVSSPSRP